MITEIKVKSVVECMACRNAAQKQVGSIVGVFGAKIDMIDGVIMVEHTDEVTSEAIARELIDMGYKILEINNKIFEYEV